MVVIVECGLLLWVVWSGREKTVREFRIVFIYWEIID